MAVSPVVKEQIFFVKKILTPTDRRNRLYNIMSDPKRCPIISFVIYHLLVIRPLSILETSVNSFNNGSG
jgi:hypothetical protein